MSSSVEPIAGEVLVDPREYLAAQQGFVDEVSTVWARQIESSRSQMDAAVATLSVRFSGIVGRLDHMLADRPGQRADAEAVDVRVQAFCDDSERRLTHVVDTLREAMRSKAEMLAKVQGLQGFLVDLGKMAAAISRIAQQTHLLSINAAIEAAHAGASGTGFAVVAQEVRSLSKMSADTGADITKTVQTLQGAIRSTQVAADESARQDADAMQHSSQTIREVIDSFAGLTSAMRESSESLRAESRAIRGEIDEAIVQLQFQDRVGQVMAHVRENIERWPDIQRRCGLRFERQGRLVAPDAQRLLAELVSTYAMAEEHQIHAGATSPSAPASNEITFF